MCIKSSGKMLRQIASTSVQNAAKHDMKMLAVPNVQGKGMSTHGLLVVDALLA